MTDSPNRSRQRLSEIPIVPRFIATGFFSGYAPIAPGTAGSAAALLFFLIPGFGHPEVLLPATLIVFILGGIAAGAAEKILGPDPPPVTIDEVAGMWLSLWFLPLTLPLVFAAFLLFRFFDIIKPFPARHFDKKSGGWNIMLDDVMAALYTNVILQAAYRFFFM
jgi:phosphatidylglycerophosphatase A